MRGLSSIEPGEGRTVTLMGLHSFAMGLATVSFETAASALFLARFGAGSLPWVYVAAALLNTITGAAFAAVQSRLPFARLMTGTLVVLFTSVAALRGALVLDIAWLPFALLVWYRALSILTDLEYWAVAGRIFDVRQAKRLFPLIGSGEVLARIAGSFAVPLLVAFSGVENLLVLSALALLACLALAAAVLRRSRVAEEPAPPPRAREEGEGAFSRVRALAADRYLLLLVGIAALAVLAKYLVDFAFLEQMRSRHTDKEQLATFFALFSGTTQALSLLARVAVAGPLLERFGLRAGLLILPLAHAACTALLVASGLVPALGAVVFWLVIANQGIYKVLKHPIDNPSFKVLYQPLRKDQRLTAQVAVETLVTPLVIGLAGALMLLFSRGMRYDPRVFAWVMLANFVAWALLATRAGRAYAGALLVALRGRIVDDGPFTYGDPRSVAVLEHALAGEHPGDVLFALDLMEKSALPGLEPALVRLVDHPAPEVRRSALLRLERLRFGSARPSVARRAGEGEPVPSVRAAALRTLCSLAGSEAWAQVSPALSDPDPEVRRGAMIGLLRSGSADGFQRLVALAGSPAASERAWAARVIGEAGQGGLHSPLLGLLADQDAGVRRAAIQAAGRVRQPELWGPVTAALSDSRLGTAAVAALGAGGEGVLDALAEATKSGGGAVIRGAARVCARVRGERAVAMLLHWLEWPEPRTRTEVLRGLVACGYRADDGAAGRLDARLREEVKDAAWTAAALRDLGDAPPLALLREALSDELLAARDRALLTVSLLHDPSVIARVGDGLRAGTREKRAYALEALDVTLSAERRELVLPLVEDLAPAQRVERLEPLFPQRTLGPAQRVVKVLGRPEGDLGAWTRACALYVAPAVAGEADGLGLIVRQAATMAATPLVRETAAWAADAIEAGEPARRGGPMLTIEKVLCLKAVEMFAEASEEILADVATILEERQARAGETIIRKGEPGDSMYIIVEGRVRVFDGDRTITFLADRDIFGELALLDPEPRAASIAAVEDTRLFRLDREAFGELLAGNIEIVRGVLHVLCERLRATSARAPRGYEPS
ncbi:MAG TPA: cyclic nucleotide-binding domain-containing protein, partial [Vicinamibacteria bacterium]|nr:cyclic nucleotide-binding domain-containing protein [Vicinamibacteria bacterium]